MALFVRLQENSHPGTYRNPLVKHTIDVILQSAHMVQTIFF